MCHGYHINVKLTYIMDLASVFGLSTTYKRRRGRVVKSGLVMVQKVTVKHEFEAGLCHAMTGKLCQPSSKWVPFMN